MSIEAIQEVNKAETTAQEQKLAAAAQAKQLVRNAETAGQLLLEQSRKEAEAQARTAMDEAEARAAQHTKNVLSANAGSCKELSSAAESRLNDAAALIVKRIVSV